MTVKTYTARLRSPVRGYWVQALTFDQFVEAMRSAINRGLEQAWAEGAAECDIEPTDFTQEELLARDRAIFNEQEHIVGLANRIDMTGS